MILAIIVAIILMIVFLAFLHGRAVTRERFPPKPKPPVETYLLLSSYGRLFAWLIILFMAWMIISRMLGLWDE